MGNVRTGFENSGRLHSGNLWKDCPIEDIQKDPTKGFYVFDDFVEFSNAGTITTVAPVGKYMAFAGSDGNIVQYTSGTTGEILMTTDEDDDGDSCSIAQSGFPFKISGISGSKTGKLWFECRVKLTSVADSKTEFFIGLSEPCTLAEAIPITDTAATLADQNIVGFYRTESDGDKYYFSYKANGVTQVNCSTTLATPVASTYMKLGFKFDPDANTLKTFIDGTETALTTAITSTKLGATAGTDFPNDVQLGLIAAVRNATGSSPSSSTYIDWWACAQLA